jgi:predicted amidophosphoribosyltransferase
MRIDSCRRCGTELKKYQNSMACKNCGKDFEQFSCPVCNVVTEPQYHEHNEA